jgi:hypothetical protein
MKFWYRLRSVQVINRASHNVNAEQTQPNDAVYIATSFHLTGDGMNIKIGKQKAARNETVVFCRKQRISHKTEENRAKQVVRPKANSSQASLTTDAIAHGKSSKREPG